MRTKIVIFLMGFVIMDSLYYYIPALINFTVLTCANLVYYNYSWINYQVKKYFCRVKILVVENADVQNLEAIARMINRDLWFNRDIVTDKPQVTRRLDAENINTENVDIENLDDYLE